MTRVASRVRRRSRMTERGVDAPGLRLIRRGGAGDGHSQRRRAGWRVASRRVARFADARTRGGIWLRYRARRKRSRETQAMAGASRNGSRDRSCIAGRVRRETCEEVARLDVENVRTLNGTRARVATAAALEERVDDGGLAFFRDLLFARARGHCGAGKSRRTRSASASAPRENRTVNTVGKTNTRVSAVLVGRVARARPSTGKIFPVS